MKKFMMAGSALVMAAAMAMPVFAANTGNVQAGPGGYYYCTFLDGDGDGICDNCANERAHCGHSGHVGACSYGEDCGCEGAYHNRDCARYDGRYDSRDYGRGGHHSSGHHGGHC